MFKTKASVVGLALVLSACGQQAGVSQQSVADLSVGTYSVQGATTVGTALALRLLLPNGQPPTQDVQVTVTGPAGWNGDAPLTFKYLANFPDYWQVDPKIAPVAGKYHVSATLGGKTVQDDSATVDPNSRLGLPTNVKVVVAADKGTISWDPVNGAAQYLSELVKVAADNSETTVRAAYLTGTQIVFDQAILETGVNYNNTVVAFNALVDNGKDPVPALPAQFNASFGFTANTFTKTP